MPALTAATMSRDLNELRRAAEEQMRRKAPRLPADEDDRPSGKRAKTAKSSDGGAGGDDDAEEMIARFQYAAPDVLINGATCFLATCNFKR